MNMIYQKGEFLGFVAIGEARSHVPLPQRWYLRHCSPGSDARVMSRLSLLDVSAWSPSVVRFIDRRTGKVASKPHLGKRVEKPFLPGLIFIPDFELDNPALRGVADLGDYMRVLASAGGRIARASDAQRAPAAEEYKFASMSVASMAVLRDIVAVENGARVGRGHRGKYKPGDKIYIADSDSPLFAFEAEVKRGVDSKGRLNAFIATLMGGVSVNLSETQVEPA